MIEIALFEPDIPQNTGNIARLCVGLNIPLNLIGRLGFKLDDYYLRRAGLDYWEYLTLKRYDQFSDFLKDHPDRRILPVTTKGETPYYAFQYRNGDILLFGSETRGLPDNIIRDYFPHSITIPMPGNVRSLNLSNSCAVTAYHTLLELNYFENFHHNRNYIGVPDQII
jgi:tRNA (cytidine/uridine-2'-O-)-methyltransferase